MTLRRKFNGAKSYTEAWDTCTKLCFQRKLRTICDDEVGAKFPLAKSLKAKFSTRMVGERSIWGEVRAKALVDCMEVRMPDN